MKILIVDDERPIRQWFRYVIQQYGQELEVAGEAANGQEALALTHFLQPDLVITDIRMPLMDGLELIAQLNRAADPSPPYILILSNYDDFEFVKKGLVAGAKNYLLKAETADEEIIAAIRAIQEQMKQEREQKSLTNSLQLRLHDLKSVFIRDWLTHDLMSWEHVEQQLDDLDLRFPHDSLGMIAFELDETPISEQGTDGDALRRQLINFSRAELAKWYPDVEVFHMKGELFLAIFGVESGKIMASTVERICGDMLVQARKHAGLTLSFCYRFDLRNRSDIHRAYGDCVRCLDYKMYYGLGCTLNQAELAGGDNSSMQAVQLLLRRALQQFQLLNQQSFRAIDDVLRRIGETKALGSTEARDLLRKIWEHAADQLMQLSLHKLPEPFAEHPFHPGRCLYWEQYCELLMDGIVQMHRTAYKQVYVYSEAVNQIIQILETHYDQKINMRMVAERVHLNENYISQLFKKETGITLQKFVMKIRMERALQLLLEGHYKINEIAGKIGYSNESHFCTSFKLYYGESPTQVLQKTKQKLRI
ncbi:response regulator [Paenibacillus piri]|uniref:Response regulator n=1 Tax=Paenibacillus piri TaxID=2547395 RepID=A0A4R5KHZ2_9BACL|nr:response regulator [Paenibacillus piri]TDF95119.1 response regulator [Paenibacillus piri]